MTQELKTLMFSGLLVKLPEGFKETIISKFPKSTTLIGLERNNLEVITELSDGEWESLGSPFELSESQAKEIMPLENNRYPIGEFKCLTAKIALLGKLAYLDVYEFNPYGDKPEYMLDYYGKSPAEFNRFELDMFKWQRAQDRTGNWTLLKRI